MLDTVSLHTLGVGVGLYKDARPPTPLMRAATDDDVAKIQDRLQAGDDINLQVGYAWRLEGCYIVHS